jgi:glycosyltransferase 2 family protein
MTNLKFTRASAQRSLYLFLGTFITLVSVAWALRGISWGNVWQALRNARLEWIALAVLVFCCAVSLKAKRWGTLIEGRDKASPFKVLQAAVYIGFAGNCILPASGGEVLRTVILNRYGKVPLGAVVGSLVAERLLDLVTVFFLLLVPIFTQTVLMHQGVRYLSLGWLGLGIAVLTLGIWIAANRPKAIAQGIGTLLQRFGLRHFSFRIAAGIEALLQGLSALRDPKRCFCAILESFCIWLLTGLTYWFCLLAFDIQTPGWLGALFTQSLVALAIALPSSPGYLGPFEAAIRFSLSFYSIPPDVIISFALTLRLLMLSSLMTVAWLLAMQLGLSGADLKPGGLAVKHRT